MSIQTDNAKAIKEGTLRALIVEFVNQPLYTLKVRRQCSTIGQSSFQIAQSIIQNEGISTFYQSLFPKLGQAALREFWRWPMIVSIPVLLTPHRLTDFQKQSITGLSIASLDATVTTPLEKLKVQLASRGKTTLSLKNIYQDGWQGYSSHLMKLSVSWVTFLTVQKHLRNKAQKQSSKPLTSSKITEIGLETGLIVSIVSAPFDYINTLQQAKNLSLPQIFSRTNIHNYFRGWPLGVLTLVTHNIGSAIVFDRLEKH